MGRSTTALSGICLFLSCLYFSCEWLYRRGVQPYFLIDAASFGPLLASPVNRKNHSAVGRRVEGKAQLLWSTTTGGTTRTIYKMKSNSKQTSRFSKDKGIKENRRCWIRMSWKMWIQVWFGFWEKDYFRSNNRRFNQQIRKWYDITCCCSEVMSPEYSCVFRAIYPWCGTVARETQRVRDFKENERFS